MEKKFLVFLLKIENSGNGNSGIKLDLVEKINKIVARKIYGYQVYFYGLERCRTPQQTGTNIRSYRRYGDSRIRCSRGAFVVR